MKENNFAFGLLTSFNKGFNLSSNSPLYLAPAIKVTRSSVNIFLFKIFQHIILDNSPGNTSTMAVLPTPASTDKNGVVLFLQERIICRILLISSSLPMMGSSFPLSAAAFRFHGKFIEGALYCSFPLVFTYFFPLRNSDELTCFRLSCN
ncbi:MAG: hypothetical protein IPI90_15740 [Saprospiraceae bacterium]|nr:hypothetical protein [Candidatus Vicinibacter affinis]